MGGITFATGKRRRSGRGEFVALVVIAVGRLWRPVRVRIDGRFPTVAQFRVERTTERVIFTLYIILW